MNDLNIVYIESIGFVEALPDEPTYEDGWWFTVKLLDDGTLELDKLGCGNEINLQEDPEQTDSNS